jgi:hypothetical protein
MGLLRLRCLLSASARPGFLLLSAPPPPPGPRPRPPERCINMYASLGTVVDVAEVVVPVTVRAVKKGEMELIKGRMRSGADSK